uniref:Uncharacterized protein n=1 Tax=Alexandrium catenella TaxID=2925 RepID=A0A7S1LTT6_ALECA|mmetsp:Transcript_13680/g.37658  ORF Transcript_13680/g.37658 Transcript_13680/m.37658 type:complete len:104 (+) Transcript_13680:3-314(+)
MACTEAAAAATKRGKELEVVLKSLRKLQDQLRELATKVVAEEPEEASDDEDGPPRGQRPTPAAPPAASAKQAVPLVTTQVSDAADELQDRLQKWSTKRKKSTR